MLLLIGVMVLAQGSKVDIKAADWWAALSAVATAGTFAVALIALNKAPDWLGQKKHEDAYNIAKNLFLDEFFELKKTVAKSGSTNETLEFELEIISDNVDDIITLESCDSALKIFRNAQYTPASMKTNFERLKVLGWNFSDDSNQKFEILNASYSKVHKHHTLLWVSLKSTINSTERKSNEEIKQYIIDMVKKLKIAEENFEVSYNEFFRFDFEEYFTISKIKKQR